MSVKVSRPNHDRYSPPTCESRGGRRLCAAPSDTPPRRDSPGLPHKNFRPPMIACALRDCRGPVSSPKPSSDAQLRA